jgi:hypothetical protein
MALQTQVNLVDWHYKEVDGTRKVCGSFELKVGATVVATQSFNDRYNSVSIPFSAEVCVAIERISKRIKEEVEAYFTGIDVPSDGTDLIEEE